MAKYRFDPEGLYDDGRIVWVLDIGADLKSGQVFEPADFGHPGWVPEPYPHPLFLDLSKPKPVPVVEEETVIAPPEPEPEPAPLAEETADEHTGEGS